MCLCNLDGFDIRNLRRKLDGVDRAVLHTFTAGDAVVGVDFAAVVRSDRIGSFELLDRS